MELWQWLLTAITGGAGAAGGGVTVLKLFEMWIQSRKDARQAAVSELDASRRVNAEERLYYAQQAREKLEEAHKERDRLEAKIAAMESAQDALKEKMAALIEQNIHLKSAVNESCQPK